MNPRKGFEYVSPMMVAFVQCLGFDLERYKPLKHELNIHWIQLTLTGQCELTTAISWFFVPEG